MCRSLKLLREKRIVTQHMHDFSEEQPRQATTMSPVNLDRKGDGNEMNFMT